MTTIAERMGITKAQIRKLRRYECAWCTQSLARETCGAIWDRCTEAVRAKRRKECLRDLRRTP